MKIKSLLLAAAAFVAFGVSAQTLTTDDITINSEDQLGELIFVPLNLELEDGQTWKNIQIEMTLPDFVYPKYDEEYLCYGYAGAAVPTSGRPPAPVVGFSDNCDDEANFPTFTILGANMTATPVGSGEIYVTQLEVREGIENGTYPVKIYTKIVLCDEEGNDAGEATIGTSAAPIDVFNIIVDLPVVTGVNDINSAKAVTSVKYYNAAGMVSDTAFDGINIVVTKYADGSQSTAKVVK